MVQRASALGTESKLEPCVQAATKPRGGKAWGVQVQCKRARGFPGVKALWSGEFML